jgi:hypothetical protein
MSQVELENAIKCFFDNNLYPGNCYSSVIGKPFLKVKHRSRFLSDDAKLVYQDGTGCSASYALSDVYQNSDGSYVVITCIGGDDPYVKNECKTVCEVFEVLISYCGHDPNSTGDMFLDVFAIDHDYKKRLMALRDPINILKNNPLLWNKMREYRCHGWWNDKA